MDGAHVPGAEARRPAAQLAGALALLLPLLPYWALLVAMAVETERQWAIGAAVVGAVWLVLAGLLVRYWARERPELPWLAAAWLLLGIFTVWLALVAAFSPSVRAWLRWALSPWPPRPANDPGRPL